MADSYHAFKVQVGAAHELIDRCQTQTGSDCGYADSEIVDGKFGLDGEQIMSVRCIAKYCLFAVGASGRLSLEIEEV
jgi:hypothetical protein